MELVFADDAILALHVDRIKEVKAELVDYLQLQQIDSQAGFIDAFSACSQEQESDSIEAIYLASSLQQGFIHHALT